MQDDCFSATLHITLCASCNLFIRYPLDKPNAARKSRLFASRLPKRVDVPASERQAFTLNTPRAPFTLLDTPVVLLIRADTLLDDPFLAIISKFDYYTFFDLSLILCESTLPKSKTTCSATHTSGLPSLSLPCS